MLVLSQLAEQITELQHKLQDARKQEEAVFVSVIVALFYT